MQQHECQTCMSLTHVPDSMVLLSKLLNSIRGVLTPRRKKRSREEMDGSGVNDGEGVLGNNEQRKRRDAFAEIGEAVVLDEPGPSKLKLDLLDADTVVAGDHTKQRSYDDLLPSVDLVKRQGGVGGPFVWKQFPLPTSSAMTLPVGRKIPKRDDLPESMIGSAVRRPSQTVQGSLARAGTVHIADKVGVDPGTTVGYSSMPSDPTIDPEETEGKVIGSIDGRQNSKTQDFVAHTEFYGRFLDRMQDLMVNHNRKFDKDARMHLSSYELMTSKGVYAYHHERIQKLAKKASSLLDYSAGEKRLMELQEIEYNMNKIRQLRLVTKSDVDFTRIVPLPKIGESDRERFKDLVTRAPDTAVLQHEASKVRLKGSDLARLSPGCWLNDEIINLYMRLLQERDTRLHAAGKEGYPRCHFFNSFFLSKLYKDTGTYDYESVRRWTVPGRLKAVGQSRKSILDCDKIIIPVNQSNVHWVVAVINLQKKRFEYFDSLNGEDSVCLNHLSQYLVDEFRNKRNEDRPDILKWPKVYPKDIPKQSNGFDCGVFLVLFADYLSKSAKLDFSQEDVEDFRVKLALDFARMEVD